MEKNKKKANTGFASFRKNKTKKVDVDGEAEVFLPHHRKPFRVRHLGLLFVSCVVLIALVLQAGLMIGKSSNSTANIEIVDGSVAANGVSVVRSGYGFSFSYDKNIFDVTATLVDDAGTAQIATEEQMRDNQKLLLTTVKSHAGKVPPVESAALLSIQVAQEDDALLALKDKAENHGRSDNEIAAQLYQIESSSDFDVSVTSSIDTTLNGASMHKTVYQLVPKFNGGVSYATVWSGVANGRPIGIKLQGLTRSSDVPSSMQSIFDSLNVATNTNVQGKSTVFAAEKNDAVSPTDTKYLADSLTPAVVKIYSVACGALVFFGEPLTNDVCDGMTGSGFLLSSNGYIGTNGHVAIMTANDILVNMLTSDPVDFAKFLILIGLSNAQIAEVGQQPALQASIIAKIYDLKSDELYLENEKNALFVSLGEAPIELETQEDLGNMFDLADTDTIKKATLVDSDYSAKDQFVIFSGEEDGFSSSDVALLKIDIADAPFIPTTTSGIIQNQKILLLGFPGDAENILVDNSKLDVSVTNGSISAIKDAAGDSGKLYQSDADASHGNSGGPAVTEDGYAFGLLTYRYSGDSQGNAAKSYIRDVADLGELVSDNGVSLSTEGVTQRTWIKGLDLYSKNHFSAAVKEFNKVASAYPAHRLVSGYIANAEQAIADGKDVSTFPVGLLIVMAAVTLAVIIFIVLLIIRHHAKHKLLVATNGLGAGAYGVNSYPQQPPVLAGQQAYQQPVSAAQPQQYQQPVYGSQPQSQSYQQPQQFNQAQAQATYQPQQYQ